MAKTDREVTKTDEEWREELTPEQYSVLRKAGTEPAFTGACGTATTTACTAVPRAARELFDSNTKFDSGTGWPSFSEPAVADAVETERDMSHGMLRTEVVCRRCGGHLGHVFDDGPGPGGQRYCINSLSLDLDKR